MRMSVFTKIRMNSKPTIFIGLLVVVLTGVLLSFFVIQKQRSSLQSSNERTLLQSIIMPYSYNGDIYLVRGDGSRSEKFQTVAFVKKFTDYDGYDGYLSVHINPKQTHLVAIKSLGQKEGGGFDGASGHRLVSIDLDTGTEEILIEAKPLERIMCPQWSPSGRQIAFWRDDDYRRDQRSDASGVFLWDIETHSLHQISKPITSFFDSCEDMGTYLRWVDDEHIAVYSVGHVYPGSPENGVWLVDVVKAVSEKIHDGQQLYIQPYYSLTTKNFSEEISALPKEVIAALWGSVENPRAAIYWSPNREFYFYHVMKEGFGAERWIERYDPEIGRSSKIKTIWWTLYRE